MSFILHQTNKKTGVVYAFEVESYRDPETKKPKSRRTYLGRIDPVTNQLIPKSAEPGKRNRSKLGQETSETEQVDSQMDILKHYNEKIDALNSKIQELEKQLKAANKAMMQARDALDKVLAAT